MSKNKKAPKTNMPPPPKLNIGVLKRITVMLFSEYRPQLITVMVCIVLASLGSTISSLFMNFLR